MLDTVLHHPRKLLLRKALFQVHLWSGILLALYAIVISLSGSILVFQDELRLASLPTAPLDPSHTAPATQVVALAGHRFPGSQLTYVGFPQQGSPWWTLYLEDAHQNLRRAYASPSTGLPLAPPGRLFIDWVLDLHVYLLAGRTGFIVNCAMGAGLLLLSLTGAILWWPGIRLWKRALTVSFHRGWKRINYDLHSAIGIWTLAIVSWWGLTAIDFLAPQQVAAVVNAIAPLRNMKPPQPVEPPPQTASAIAALDTILVQVPALAAGNLSGVTLPDTPGGNVTVYVDRRKPGDFSHQDILTFDGHSGKLLTLWHYGRNRSLGDWVLWLVYPLHFGTVWGLGVKILWAALGLSVSVLSVTGLLMYWNRKLRHLVRSI